MGPWIAGAAAVLVALGCQRSAEWVVEDRWVEGDPALLAPAELTVPTVVEAWPVTTEADSWRTDADIQLTTSARGLVVRSPRKFIWLERDVEIDAAAVDLVVVKSLGSKRSALTLEWAGEGEAFDPGRRLEVFRATEAAGGENVYRFPLRGEASWTGRIKRLRLGLRIARNQVLVSEAGAWAERPDPDALASAVARPWRATLDNETRTVLLSLPGLETTRDATVVRGAALHFGYGVDPRATVPVTFTVSARAAGTDGAGGNTGGNNDIGPLFESTIAPGDGTWHEASVDLSSLAGRAVQLRLATSSPSAYDPLLGFAYWAHPELVAPVRADAKPRPPNVVLISIDTLRADHLSLYGYDRPTSPRLDAWAAEKAAVFETAVAPSPWTLPSHVSMLTGLDTVRHGVNHARPMPADLRSLAETLREAGLATSAVTAGGYVHPLYGLAQGFDRFRYFAVNMGHRDEIEHGLRYALEALDAHQDRPFFLFFHTYEVHMPFSPRQPWFSTFSPHDPALELIGTDPPARADDGYLSHKDWHVRRGDEVIDPSGVPEALESLPRDLYDAGIAYTDDHIGRLLARLETLGLDGRTIVVVTSDHGDMLGEHGAHNHLYVYDENLLIPLVIADPAGRGAGARIGQQVRTVDIVPTVLALAGLAPEPGLDGVSLVPLLEGRPLALPPAWSYASASNWGLSLRLQDRFKYVFKNAAWAAPAVARDELFDLRQGEGAAVPADAARLAPYRAQAEALFETLMPGLRVRIKNGEATPLVGSLVGPAIGTNRVKRASVDACDCFTITGGRRLVFEVPPGEEVTVAIEDVPASPLMLEVGRGGGDYADRLDVGALGPEGMAARRVDGAWSTVAGTDALDHGIAFWWQGNATVAAPAPEDENEALREQLEALGYLGG